jgi:RNA polymerase sigma factor (sigma-70 family)
MPAWRDEKLLELANQLTYSPADKRHEQLNAAIDLLGSVDATKSYPWDFIHFRITSFQPRTHIDHVVAGKVLRADLSSLVEFLSDTLSIKVEEAAPAGDTVMEFDEVSRKFNVSSKTIQRWRKQGLVALRYLHPDGRRRLGFLESAVTRFAAANKDRVDRSASFKQLSEEEKALIIQLARRHIAQSPCCIRDISRLIGQKFGRAPETIRYTIRKHDREHPEAAVFPEVLADGPQAGRADRDAQMNAPGNGLSLERIAEEYGATPTDGAGAAAQERAQQIKLQDIGFVANPLFEHPDAANIILKVLPEEAIAQAQATVTSGKNSKTADVYMARMPRDLPAFLADIFRQPVMPQEIETDAFRRMNYLKFEAAHLQKALDPAQAPEESLARIETLLAQAAALKNMILQGNLRVAVHVARKHQRADRPLMELVSDATMWVMRAIDKFDFSRHTRFSTYAGYAIMKNFARDRVEQLTRRDTTMLTGQEEVLNAVDDPQSGVEEKVDAALLQSDLRSVIDDLPAKDRELIARHYGLEQGKPPLSLAELGDQMGLTKARVRQLEARALQRLRLLMEARREKIRNAAARPK